MFADRELDSYEVRHHIDQRDQVYVIGMRTTATADRVAIEKTVDHAAADDSVDHEWLAYEGERHPISFRYLPKDTSTVDGTSIEARQKHDAGLREKPL